MIGIPQQVNWALQQIQQRAQELLEEAAHGPAAQMLDSLLVQAVIDAIWDHLDKEGDLRSQAIEENLISSYDWYHCLQCKP